MRVRARFFSGPLFFCIYRAWPHRGGEKKKKIKNPIQDTIFHYAVVGRLALSIVGAERAITRDKRVYASFRIVFSRKSRRKEMEKTILPC